MALAIIKKSGFTFLNTLVFFFFFLAFLSGYAQVGINTAGDPTSTLEVNGSMSKTVTTVVNDLSLTDAHSIVVCNNGITARTITLPTAVGISGRIYTIKRDPASTANVTVATTSSQTIDGAANLILAKAGEVETLFSDGANWKTLSDYNSSSAADWSLTGNTGTTAETNFIGTTDAKDFVIKTNNTEKMRILSDGNVGIGVAVPTAALQLKAGTTAAGTAPLKFTSQAASLTIVEPGTFEYVGRSLQFSQFVKRRGIAMSEDVRIANTTLSNTLTESAALATVQHGAGYLEIGKSEETVLRGTIEQRNHGNAFITFNIKYAGAIIHSLTTTSGNAIVTGSPFVLTVIATCRTIGATGTMQINSFLQIAGEALKGGSFLASVDTTTAQETTVTAIWNEARSENILVVEQSRTLCIEQNK